MDTSIARKGIEECEQIFQQFQKLLQVLGRGNLLFDKQANPDPSSVPQKCEESKTVVAKMLNTIQSSLEQVKACYQICQVEITTNGSKMPTLEDLARNQRNTMETEKSQEYMNLKQQLQKKNAELKIIIDEVRQIFSDINQLGTLVPYGV